MKRLPVEYLPAAMQDILGILDYYQNATGLKGLFLEDLDGAARQMSSFPESIPSLCGGYRRKLLSRFPYAVYYVIAEGRIDVVRVFHTSRRPDSWR
jgi:plasmid stabilization system protein ParE